MRIHGGCLTRQSFLVWALVGGMLPLSAAPTPPVASTPPAKAGSPEAQALPLVEAFQKGPISITAKVTRALSPTEHSVVPLFQVPVLKFKDRLELSFSGEAFDQRVTSADWSLIVVFLPHTIAPTDQGVVDYTLKRKDDRMVIPAISVPYDSIPMIFLIPDRNAKRKVLKDLNDHLEAFRTLCAKIADISTQRAAADKFLQDLDAIDKSLSPAQYDNALQRFLHAYGDEISTDLQTFTASSSSNLDKCNLITQEFRNTNVLVPGSAPAQAVVASPVAVTAGERPASAYVSIIFDLAAIINNLWPGHQFQYLPAVARDFHDFSADLYYSSWIRTTGDLRGALMCCPGSWEEQTPPTFDFELPTGESLLTKQFLLRTRPKENSRGPFALFGHDWKLLLTGPKGESLPPLPLAVSPNKQSFVAAPGPALDTLRKLNATQVKARIVGCWGFTSIAMAPQTFPTGIDLVWAPSPAELEAFQIGKPCAFKLPAAWAGTVERVTFRPAAAGAEPLVATLKAAKDGSKEARFEPKPEDAGPGTLEIHTFGLGHAALARPMTLAEAPPEATGLEARLDDTTVVLHGRHLRGVTGLLLGERRFLPVGKDKSDGPTRSYQAEDGKPLDGSVGAPLGVTLVTAKGKRPAKGLALLLPARPRLRLVQVTPADARKSSLAISSSIPIAPANDASLVSLLTAKGYRFPSDPSFRVAIRNPEDPSEIRTILPSKIRVMGRDQKATFILNPAELLGGRASGKLEVQVEDDRAGASDWIPLPDTFLELPNIGAIQTEATGFQLTGQSLDQIEAVAPAKDGPWENTAVTIEEGREVARLNTPLNGNTCYIKLFGWSDLVLSVKLPPPAPPTPKPLPTEPKPALPAPAASRPAEPAPKEPVPATPAPPQKG
ncbi:MAG: hypothetical protein P4L36_19740 [Holophaga sp.]|nr:hypothetical protein [Holophaga sp.]